STRYTRKKNTFFVLCDLHYRSCDNGRRISGVPCCEQAINIEDYDKSGFIIHADTVGNHVIPNPKLWTSNIHYLQTFIQNIVKLDKNGGSGSVDSIKRAFRQFESSNFKDIGSLPPYRSGKDSVIRNKVQGFRCEGFYHTGSISCELPRARVLLPSHVMYSSSYPSSSYQFPRNVAGSRQDILLAVATATATTITPPPAKKQKRMVVVKRDPVLKTTGAHVCIGQENPDKSVSVVVTCDSTSEPQNKDQDGDKNGVLQLKPYDIPTAWDYNASFAYKAANMELITRYDDNSTISAKPRYSFSEQSKLLLRNCNFQRHFLEAGCGYRRNEVNQQMDKLRGINASHGGSSITVDDLRLATDVISNVYLSGAKGHEEGLQNMLQKVAQQPTHISLAQSADSMLKQMNLYLDNSKKISIAGRMYFCYIYGYSDVLVYGGQLVVNKIGIANTLCDVAFATQSHSTASYLEWLKDIRQKINK
ncbi:uncharacterized protein LOC135834132, partial [Planococcus citri]|uniref:uncharacterized protein LOC135834132 n=1 Tax=Planococcus citri TaxID=170843 RepID=UPI0031F9F5C5